MTLNDLPEGLHTWLPPTDCRLRPDLRAFESGKFDQANGLKQGLEELQRATRRQREAGELPAHAPRWFKRVTDPDTQAEVWKPERRAPRSRTAGGVNTPARNGGVAAEAREVPSYWDEREKVGTERSEGAKAGKKAEWENVHHIFGQFEVE